MKKTVIAFNPEHVNRLKDSEIKTLARLSRKYPLKSYFLGDDPRNNSFPDNLYVPALEVTEELKTRFQTAFSEVGLPVLFVPVRAA
jgi:hypothetical protein